MPISDGQRRGLGALVAKVSPETFEAMKEPVVDDDLYDWESIADRK